MVKLSGIVPEGSSVLPVSHDEFVRHGAATGVPRKVFDLWVEVGAFVVPERDPHRRGIGDGYRLLDPYTVADMQDPGSPAFLTDPSGYPFVEYGNSTLFCVDEEGNVMFSFDRHVVETDMRRFLSNLAEDLAYVEKIKDEARLRLDPDARLRQDVRRIVAESIKEVSPTSMRDMGPMMKAIGRRASPGEDLARYREIATEEISVIASEPTRSVAAGPTL